MSLSVLDPSGMSYTPVNKAGDTMTGNLSVASFINTTNSSYFGQGNQIISGASTSDTGILTGGNILFGTNAGFGNYERARIDSSGRVMKPYQPSFYAYGDSTWSAPYTCRLPLMNVDHNIGNCYNTSTYIFTAPVAGRYFFYTQVYRNGSAYYRRLFIRKNGANMAYNLTSIGGVDNTASTSCVITLAANDSVDAYWSPDDSGSFFSGQAHTFFCGYLLG